MKIAIIGAGSVGTNLHHAFELKGIHTELVHGRPLTADPEALKAIPQADVYIYTIADHALCEVVTKVDAPKALHIHTSGSMPLDVVFGKDKPHAGVMYFFQSFSRHALIDDWSNIPCFYEGRSIDDVAAICTLAQNLTSHVYDTTQHDRERVHVAGVFANNYVNLMYRMAKEVLKDTSVPFEVLFPLIDLTAAKVHTHDPREVQTGPASRADIPVIMHHASVLFGLDSEQFTTQDLTYSYLTLAQAIYNSKHGNPEDGVSFIDLLTEALEELNGKRQNHPIPARIHRKPRE